MSATIIEFPESIIRPDLARCSRAIELCEDDPEKLMFLAFNALQLVYYRKSEGPAERREQLAFDRLTIAYLALGKMLGIGEGAEGRSHNQLNPPAPLQPRSAQSGRGFPDASS